MSSQEAAVSMKSQSTVGNAFQNYKEEGIVDTAIQIDMALRFGQKVYYFILLK